jgi:transposase-like protein
MTDLDERLDLIRECVARRRMESRLCDTVPEAKTSQPRQLTGRNRPRVWKTKNSRIVTPEQENEIAERLRRGEKERDIARKFHVSKYIPRRIRVQLQIPYRGRPGRHISEETRAQIVEALRSQQGTYRELGKRFNVCKATLGQIKRKMMST